MKKIFYSSIILLSMVTCGVAFATSLTSGTIPVYDTAQKTKDSNITQDSCGNIGICSTSPRGTLDVGPSGTIWGDGSHLTNLTAGGWTDDGTNVFTTATSDNVAIGTTTPISGDKVTISGGNLRFKGTAARTIGMNRETTAATAGHNLTIDAGGGVSGGTDLDGGDLILQSGQATGLGQSYVRLRVPSSQTSTGTAESTPVDRVIVVPGKTIVEDTDTDMFEIDISGNTSCGGSFAWETSTVDASLEYQISSGLVNYSVYNKSGTLGMDIVKVGSDSLASSSGTLTDTFKVAQVGTNMVVRINHASSLTPASGHPRLQYTVFNNCYKNVTICEGNTCP